MGSIEFIEPGVRARLSYGDLATVIEQRGWRWVVQIDGAANLVEVGPFELDEICIEDPTNALVDASRRIWAWQQVALGSMATIEGALRKLIDECREAVEAEVAMEGILPLRACPTYQGLAAEAATEHADIWHMVVQVAGLTVGLDRLEELTRQHLPDPRIASDAHEPLVCIGGIAGIAEMLLLNVIDPGLPACALRLMVREWIRLAGAHAYYPTALELKFARNQRRRWPTEAAADGTISHTQEAP